MKSWILPLAAIGLVAAGAAGRWIGYQALEPGAIWYMAFGLSLLSYLLFKTTYYRSETPWPQGSNEPKRLTLSWLDYLKSLNSWFDAFKRTYVFEPGLYYTGSHYDPSAPLLVTSNYHLTVFLVARRARAFNARLLVIDTDGINVWCAAGKEKFNNVEILKQLERYDPALFGDSKKTTLILPKFGLAGVDLRALRQDGIRPVIGPLYAKDLPRYLDNPPYKDCDGDVVAFGLMSRVFTWLPGFVQYMYYSMILVIALMLLGRGNIAGETIGLVALLATAYPVLFPWIPGRRFAVKGIWLAAFTSLGLGALALAGLVSLHGLIVAVLFTFATALFFALSYTGNSAVSNYTRVRAEIARFLPATVLLYLASLTANLLKGVWL